MTSPKLYSVLPVIAAVMLASCSPGQITSSIQVALDALEVALPLIAPQAGVSPDVIAAAEQYASAANAGLDKVTSILQSGESSSNQVIAITAALSGLASANLPPGTPQAIADAISKIARSIGGILSNFPSTGAGGLAARVSSPAPVKLSSGDRAALAKAKTRLAVNAVKLSQMRR